MPTTQTRRLLDYRPYLYHLTSDANRTVLQQHPTLYPAGVLFQIANAAMLRRMRGQRHHVVPMPFGAVQIRDQGPLHFAHVDLQGGWSEPDFIDALNARVFFWPGTEAGPIAAGENHYRRYSSECPVVLRVPTADLLSANPSLSPEFCSFNSGAPRSCGGRKSPRGPDTFMPHTLYQGSVSTIVEIAFTGAVSLPASTEYARTTRGVWLPF